MRDVVEGTVIEPEEETVEVTFVVTELRLPEDTEVVLVEVQTEEEEEITGVESSAAEQELLVSSSAPSEAWPLTINWLLLFPPLLFPPPTLPLGVPLFSSASFVVLIS